jgi:predicted phage replisome organizer
VLRVLFFNTQKDGGYMAEVKWIKLTVDMFDDEKIKIIQSMPEGDTLLVVWIKLITLAGKTNDGGYVYISEGMPYTDEMLSIIMNKPLNTIRLALDTFTKLGMIEADFKGIYLLNFEKHQSLDKLEKLKEQNRLRVAKYREKQKQLECNVTSPLQVTQSNAIDIDKDIDIEIDKENNNKRKNFVKPTIEEVQEYCTQRNNNIDAENFIDYYEANGWKVGKNPMKDWKAAIRTWERRNTKQPTRKEIVPDWMDKKIEKQPLSPEHQKKMEELLKEFKGE